MRTIKPQTKNILEMTNQEIRNKNLTIYNNAVKTSQ
jgi:hypothetical protein